jgi:predicted nucleotidyltransferase component of viral defense system
MLKGAMLFVAWTGQAYRPTADMDFLGYGEDSSERLLRVFQDVSQLDVEPDGLTFDESTIKVVPIRQDLEYKGKRITLTAFLGKSRIPVQIDVGFGDVVTPKSERISYPTLLKYPAPTIQASTRETVVAEKFQTLVVRGIANSRMKDFYDLYILSRNFEFTGKMLVAAIKATFKRRKTDFPQVLPLALTEEFGLDVMKTTQWNAFIRKGHLEAIDFPEALTFLRSFLLPILQAITDNTRAPDSWKAGGPWV